MNQTLLKVPTEMIRTALLDWWPHHKRYFPWRNTQNPYEILIAETILHRTRAEQALSLYEGFLQIFPDISSLAGSTPDQLTQLFHSGGLHWRWKLLHNTAVELQEKFSGRIPDDFDLLVSLPGISHYIASAIRCFAFGYPDALLDTNTVRVAGRLTGLNVNDSSRRSPVFRAVLERLIDRQYPRDFNFALIDLAALICKSRNPVHGDCCLKDYCYFNDYNKD